MKLFRSVAYNWQEGGPALVARKAVVQAKRLLSHRHELLVYVRRDLDADSPESLDPGTEIRELDRDELIASGYFKAVAFPEMLEARFPLGDRCLGIFFDGRIGHVAWLAHEHCPLDIGLPDMPIPGGVALYDEYTLPEFRGRGAGTASVRRLCAMGHEDGSRYAVALIHEDNVASRHVHEKCGFGVAGPVVYRRRLWRETFEYPDL